MLKRDERNGSLALTQSVTPLFSFLAGYFCFCLGEWGLLCRGMLLCVVDGLGLAF